VVADFDLPYHGDSCPSLHSTFAQGVPIQVYEAVGEVLRRLGVEVVFGLMGDGNMLYVTHMTQALGMRYYWARHETPAVSMADGYARVSGRLGVATVTQGPGVTNSLTALTEAVKGKTPLLFITGATPTTTVGMPQDMPQAEVVSAAGVGVQRLGGAETLIRDVAAESWPADHPLTVPRHRLRGHRAECRRRGVHAEKRRRPRTSGFLAC